MNTYHDSIEVAKCDLREVHRKEVGSKLLDMAETASVVEKRWWEARSGLN